MPDRRATALKNILPAGLDGAQSRIRNALRRHADVLAMPE